MTIPRLKDVLPSPNQTEPLFKSSNPEQNIPEAQEIICKFFLSIVKQRQPELVIYEFKQLFINPLNAVNSQHQQALEQIILSKDEEAFRNTLRRCCYIILNNLIAARNYNYTQELIKLFSKSEGGHSRLSLSQKYLRRWIENFVNTKDYQELKLFAGKYENRDKAHWKSRYASYLLVPQYLDSNNCIEHRKAAKLLSKQLQEQFKFDLAMYTARAPAVGFKDSRDKNPTALGDEALRLVKKIVAKRGSFSYANLANIFINQTQQLNYNDFKQSLLKYLVFSEENKGLVESIKSQIGKKLEFLYEKYHEEQLNSDLLLKTCNRVIEYLTTEKQGEPAGLFVSLASQGNPLTLAIILLKLILICPPCRTYLAICIAKLINYYEESSPEECHWVINFMEITKIILTIYTENVRYNLVNMEDANQAEKSILDDKACRIFSQTKWRS